MRRLAGRAAFAACLLSSFLASPILAGGGAERTEEVPCMFVQAHRGFSASYPENTMLAFRRAAEVGADRLEMDLALTRDDVVVLLHDRTLDRTTDGRGPVASFEAAHVAGLDAGAWRSAAFAGERVPTLREVLTQLPEDVAINLELKTRDRSGALVRRTVDATLRLLHEVGALDRVIVSSFDALALRDIGEREPHLRLLLLDWDAPSAVDGLSFAIDFGFWGWSPSAQHASADRIARAKAAGLHVHVGAGPDASTLRRLHDWGVDGVSSGDPEALVLALEGAGLRPRGERCDALGRWPR